MGLEYTEYNIKQIISNIGLIESKMTEGSIEMLILYLDITKAIKQINFTKREWKILKEILQGKNIKEISDKLKTHRSSISRSYSNIILKIEKEVNR